MRLSLIALTLVSLAMPASAETTFSYGAAFDYNFAYYGPGTDNVAEAKAYGEMDFGGLYVGVTGRKSQDTSRDRVGLNFGYRGTLGSWGYDASYYHYFYALDPDLSNYGEAGITFSKDFNDKFSGSLYLGHDVTNRLSNVYLGASYAASDTISIAANVGVYQVEAAPNESEWDIGATYYLSDTVGLDARFYDGTEYDGYFGLSLSFDTSITN